MAVSQEDKKRKIKLFETHFAWVNESLLEMFTHKTGIKKRSEWIKKCAKRDFDITLSSPEDIPKLDMVVKVNLYEDKGEWIRECMRKEIKKATT